MPKSKKQKVVSLVSAYESGAEDEDSNQSMIESDASEDESVQSCSEDSPHERDDKTSKGEASSGEESATRSPASNAEGAPMTSDTVPIEKEGTFAETDQPTESKPEGANEDIEASLRVKYTLENGFPSGCDQIKLPPAPRAPCSQTLQNKIVQVIERMEKYGYSINDDIERKKKFRNPSIYEKLIEAYGIDEYGSNFPTYVDLKSQNYMFYDELDKVQQDEWARREKERKDRTKIEMVSGTKKKL